MTRDRILAFAQLLRLPNVFTAFADIALGACVGAALLSSAPFAFWGAYLVLALASGCLYLAGMVWNDYFDLAEDKKTRAFRPLPSGRVRVGTAVALGVVLMATGVVFAALAGALATPEWNHEPLVYAIGLVAAVLIYDGGAKYTPFGPVAMAACRFLNVLLGLSLIPEDALDIEKRVHLAGVVGVYIVGVTWFARTEEGTSRKRDLSLAAGVMFVALVLALLLRAKIPAPLGTVAFPYLLVAFGFLIGLPVAHAIGAPGARNVQRAVKRCVLGLVVLDAVLATMFIGLPGLLLLLLLPTALWLGKWVYST
ncbi:UbiA family prenyltransferase [Gemmata sp. JC717]|uniref:UbiA family prenyltransferase n=1 Tax=Gemmata algarum TaxID=2975278 RepID=UPI0021BA501F|nr:UbiA family prenyltransferase [Gemmata algarum]MDY3551197.1 UbiA family prenyltransferase [Gemmata algarum]